MVLKGLDPHLEVTGILSQHAPAKGSKFRPTVGLLIKYVLNKQNPKIYVNSAILDKSTFPLELELQYELDILRVINLIRMQKMRLILTDTASLVGEINELDLIDR